MGYTVETEEELNRKSVLGELAVKWDLPSVYKMISDEIGSNSGLLGEVCRYLISSPGKGLRPLLVLICSSFGHLEKEAAVRLAAAMEMLHMAMLVHDDILDCSPVRRGKPAVHCQWDRNTAILAGDYLFGKSLELAGEFGKKIGHRFAGIILDTTVGEFLQAEELFDPSLEIETYLERIRKKTAAMIANCCAMAGVASCAQADIICLLENFGTNMGIAFQIKDDVSDWETGQVRGKPVIHDFRQGVLTLPVLFVLRLSEQKEIIRQIVLSREISDRQLFFVKGEVEKNGVLELALEAASVYTAGALQCLEDLPISPARGDLEKLVRNIL